MLLGGRRALQAHSRCSLAVLGLKFGIQEVQFSGSFLNILCISLCFVDKN